ncbi:MAG TPA: hypothetical protein VIH86_10390, partial [Puia sp.]
MMNITAIYNRKIFKSIILIAGLLVLLIPKNFAQPDPAKPDLCQGAYYTEEQAVNVLKELSTVYHDKDSWKI